MILEHICIKAALSQPYPPTTMPHTCAECRAEGTDDLVLLACCCHVHPACLERRQGLCLASGVHAFRCAQCWLVVWNAGKRRNEDSGEEEFKRLKL
jgi:hypothetical protein